MKSYSKLVGPFQSVINNGRTHAIVTDLGTEKGGADQGPTALELTVMALSGCITTIWAIVAKNSNVSYSEFSVDIDAEKPDNEKTITRVTGTAKVVSDEDEEKLQRVLQKTMDTCPVGVLYEKAGVDMNIKLVKE